MRSSYDYVRFKRACIFVEWARSIYVNSIQFYKIKYQQFDHVYDFQMRDGALPVSCQQCIEALRTSSLVRAASPAMLQVVKWSTMHDIIYDYRGHNMASDAVNLRRAEQPNVSKKQSQTELLKGRQRITMAAQ